MPELPTVRALAGWYGSNRILAEEVGRQLSDRSAVIIPFAGGMSELIHINARTIVVSDCHRHMINLARVAGDPKAGPQLVRWLRRRAFHPDELAAAQAFCKAVELDSRDAEPSLFSSAPRKEPSIDLSAAENKMAWARAYFVCCWMGRGGYAGKKTEFDGMLSVRFNANGGDSARRYFSAVSAYVAWRKLVLGRCSFLTEDCFSLLEQVKDENEGAKDTAIYCDPPWPDAGDEYVNKFPEHKQRRLAIDLGQYRATKVLIRYGDHPLIRELYPEGKWNWKRQSSRAQSGKEVAEVLICNGPFR
jgi:site-specific DNA-adenine methylase